MDFHLAARFTFLEYVPVKKIQRCKSAPDVLLAQSHSVDSPSEACRLGSVSPKAFSFVNGNCTDADSYVSDGFVLERLTGSTDVSADTRSSCVQATSAIDEPKKAAFIQKTTPSPCWSVGSALHSQGLCKPCAWYWRPGSCSRGLDCRHCHLCPKGALQKKKYENRQLAKALREQSVRCGIPAPTANHQSEMTAGPQIPSMVGSMAIVTAFPIYLQPLFASP